MNHYTVEIEQDANRSDAFAVFVTRRWPDNDPDARRYVVKGAVGLNRNAAENLARDYRAQFGVDGGQS